jgi:hypothetical protein
MEILAYAAFILILAIPFLVIAAIAATFVAGIRVIVAGIAGGRLSRVLFGVVLMVGSGAAAMVIAHWATSPPTDAATSAHRVVYQTYQGLRMQYLAMRWLRDGTANGLRRSRPAILVGEATLVGRRRPSARIAQRAACRVRRCLGG